MSFHSIGIFLLTGLLTVSVHAEQTCRDKLEESTPTSRFTFNDDGTVTDTETKIVWMRCAIGQQWDGKTCTGKAKAFNWQEAREAVADINSDSFGDPKKWRLPYVPELASITERKCFEPRVNQAVFPGTPAMAFWTGMERKGDTEKAYAIDFGKGSVMPTRKTNPGYVRLMLDGPGDKWWEMKHPAAKKKSSAN
ncbi:Lcl C-terminal domain-containing protein [Kaarinaea lacus]